MRRDVKITVKPAIRLLPKCGAELAGIYGVTRGLPRAAAGGRRGPQPGCGRRALGTDPRRRTSRGALGRRARGAGASSGRGSVLTQRGPDVGSRLFTEKGPSLPHLPVMLRPTQQKPCRLLLGARHGVPPFPAASSARGDARRATFHF